MLGPAGCLEKTELGDPLPGLTRAQRELFARGRMEFERVFVPETGLGPLFNADSCAECHEAPVAGGPGDEVELHATANLGSGACDLLLAKGGPVFQQAATPALKAALGIEREPLPAGEFQRASRSTPDVFGFGLLDAVPDAAILALSDPDDRDGDGISGRPNRFVDGRLGRFGRKAFVPTLRLFNAGAFVLEQGITNPEAAAEESIGGNPIPTGVDPVPEPEISLEALDATDAFVRFLAPVAPLKLSKAGKRGADIFSSIGCHRCHVPKLKTGDHPVAALKHKVVAAYTDMLLHDMGPELADICLGLATPSEFRTEPLMGLRLMEFFLHDGRAKTVEEAILLHGGEGAPARDRFRALTEADRAALLEFLRSL
jgi:CxxC motif-containing protein (DUF1111 family)